MLYLDHAATTPIRPQVWEEISALADRGWGNPTGFHASARAAKNALEEARERVAAVLGCRPLEVVFTGGGTESDNLAVKGAALAGGERGGVVTSAVEHEAVLSSARFLEDWGCTVTRVGVDRDGLVDPSEVAAAVTPDTAVVSVMAANNETGARQPVREITEAVRERTGCNVLVHTDAVQAFVSEELAVEDLGVDLLSLAAHKFGGPTGVGVLFVRDGVALEPVAHGGGQELGRRSGSHHVLGAVGMALAMELTAADRERFRRDVSEARRRFEEALSEQVPGLSVTSHSARTVQHSHLRFPGVANQTLLVRLDRLGLAASAGSSCQSGAAQVSHVLSAMGLSGSEARTSVRFSFGWTTQPSDGDLAAKLTIRALEGLL
ncbi:MAG: cysteine desulfurase family protein [bacterium]|nr:cysteine desulfurase family protein [bacterium]MDE0601672.1 cysteine desulfurase family protein [bacterium]